MTYTPPTVAPPAPLPFDPSAIAGAALDVLRLDPTDDDADRVKAAAVVACDLIAQELDYATAPLTVPAPVADAAVMLTVELYRRKDAPFGLTDSWSVDGASLRISSDVLRGVRSELAPYRSRFGVG